MGEVWKHLGCLHPCLAGTGSAWTWPTCYWLALGLKSQHKQSLVDREQRDLASPTGSQQPFQKQQVQCLQGSHVFCGQLLFPEWGILISGLACSSCCKKEPKLGRIMESFVLDDESLRPSSLQGWFLLGSLNSGVVATFSLCSYGLPLTSLTGLWVPW